MDALFDDADSLEPAETLACVQRSDSTPETRERYAFLKSKRKGAVWQEGRHVYRMGPQGVTIFDTEKWEAA